MVFAFRKMKPITRDDHGRPVYEKESSSLPEVSEGLVDESSPDYPNPKKFKSDSTT